jgi:acetyltransferase-like isoleucine patch superfamily enzyme
MAKAQPLGTVGMFKTLIKSLWWDLHRGESYRELLFKFLNIFPGESGCQIRGHFLGKLMKSAGLNTKINAGSVIYFPAGMQIGDNFQLNTQCVIHALGGLICGNDVLIGPGVTIWTINHEYTDLNTPINTQGWNRETVNIGNDVWLAANVTILPGTHIPNGVIIGASSLVTKKDVLEPFCLYGGNPIRKIKHR